MTLPCLFFFLFHVLGQSTPLDQSFNGILQLDEIAGVMVMPFMKAVVLQLVRLRYLSDRVRNLDSSFPEFCVGTVLVDFLLRYIQRRVPLTPTMHTSINIAILLMGLLPCGADGFGVNKYGVIEMCI